MKLLLNAQKPARFFIPLGFQPLPLASKGESFLSLFLLPKIKKRGKRAEIKPFSSRQELAKHTPAFYPLNVQLPFDVDILAVIFEKVVVQYDRDLFEQSRVNALTLEDAVDVGSVAA